MDQAKQFGPFVVERMVGRGGMGAVYRAHHEQTGQVVAIKALLQTVEQERERFEAEISTLKLLRHENIVKLYGFGQEEGALYYAMEYVDGPSLSTLLKRGRRFTWEEVVYIGESICRALKHAHDRGVVHRDIKPANILLPDTGVVKVSDYGIAQYFGNSRLTNAHEVVGTIEYMAPEQAQAGAVTPRTDIYALGALMYALLTGKPPYVARSLPELLQSYRQGSPESIRSFRPETPKIVDELVLGLLQIQPEKRAGDARIIGRRLAGILRTSENYNNGNPLLGRSEVQDKGARDQTSASRVDLENPSGTQIPRSAEERPDYAPDFPYRAIAEEFDAPLDFQSPYDKTTEVATKNSAAPQVGTHSSDHEDSGSFFLQGEEVDAAGTASSGTAETSAAQPSATGHIDLSPVGATLTGVSAVSGEGLLSEGAKSNTNGTSGSRLPYNYANEGVNEKAPTLNPTDSAISTDFSMFDEQTDASQSADADSTRSSTAGTQTSASPLPQSSPANNNVDPNQRKEQARKKSATTVVAKPEATESKSSEPTVRAATPSATDYPSPKNIPFEELDDYELPIKATPLQRLKRNQFTPVNEEELGELPSLGQNVTPYIRVRMIAMLLALVLIAASTFLALKSPSPDSLYRRVDEQVRDVPTSRFTTALRRSEKDMRRFVELYPNDPRANKINYFLCELEIDELDTKLERQLQSSGKSGASTPVVRAYLDARRVAMLDWETGREKLRAFIELFGSEAMINELDTLLTEERVEVEQLQEQGARRKRKPRDASFNSWRLWHGQKRPVLTTTEQLVTLAARHMQTAQAENEKTRRADLALLNDRLLTAQTLNETQPERAEGMRRAARVLYGDQPWAHSALQALGQGKLSPEELQELRQNIEDDATGTESRKSASEQEQDSRDNDDEPEPSQQQAQDDQDVQESVIDAPDVQLEPEMSQNGSENDEDPSTLEAQREDDALGG
ncbi:MAG: protein kinase [Planctomycetia bacterium]|nr:protein kinase [Planctomycetia bacterium]